MKRIACACLLCLMPLCSWAVEEGPELAKADIDLGDEKSLQRGARTFVNYCLTCHSATYMRFSRMAKDLRLSDKLVADNLMFVTDKVGNTMNVTMLAKESEAWFGMVPPDLSVIARSRGVDWLYTFLTSFYLDPSRPTGVNNRVFKDTAMPHVLWELQGFQEPVLEAGGEKKITALKLTKPGKLDESAYRQTVNDLVNFLEYLGEPAALERKRLGPRVLLFLAAFGIIAYLLKREYWKDLH